MEKHYVYKTKGVCSREISFDIIDGLVQNVNFVQGCRGNTQGVARLAEGRKPEEIIGLLKGVICRNDTSCPDQFARALEEAIKE